MKIILLGPPGSGKGTVSEKLVQDFGLKQVSPGVLLREEVAKETTLGNDIKKIMESGDLVPDQFVVEIVKLEIMNNDNFILDGFPRTLAQAESISEIGVDRVISLDVPEEIVIERFSGRRVCSKCKAGYHTKYIPSKEEGICDKCGGELIQREDDVPEVIKERFRVYHEKTQPLIDYYQNKGLLKTVDGAPAPDVVYESVKTVVEEFKEKTN